MAMTCPKCRRVIPPGGGLELTLEGPPLDADTYVEICGDCAPGVLASLGVKVSTRPPDPDAPQTRRANQF